MDNKIDLVVSFDTTGSMYPVLAQVRQEVEKFVTTMFNEFSDLRLGVIAHGDYCDAGDPYTIIYKELCRDEQGLCQFVRNVEKTYGGDSDECYELVLDLANTQMNWRDDADKLFIIIGDASPHSPMYRDNRYHIDWKEETEKLRKLGVKVFSVHAMASARKSSRAFYKYMAEQTGGVYLTLEQFHEIVDLIKATVYQQSGEEKLNEFVTIIKDSGKMTRTMDNNIKRLRGEKVDDAWAYDMSSFHSASERRRAALSSGEVTIKRMDGLVPVMPSRFQVMTVDEDCAIKEFVTKNGIEFKKGRGFYELTKAETVQQYKEVIMQDRSTGDMFNGSQVREKLGLQPQSEKGGVNERLHKDSAKDFRVFVQSTSVNRKLIAGTTFLYEVPDYEDEGGTIIPDDILSKFESKPADVREEKEPAKKPARKKVTVAEKKVDEAKEEESKTPTKKPARKKVTVAEKKVDEVKEEESKTPTKKPARKKEAKVPVEDKAEAVTDAKGAPEDKKEAPKRRYSKPEIVGMPKSKSDKAVETDKGAPEDKKEAPVEKPTISVVFSDSIGTGGVEIGHAKGSEVMDEAFGKTHDKEMPEEKPEKDEEAAPEVAPETAEKKVGTEKADTAEPKETHEDSEADGIKEGTMHKKEKGAHGKAKQFIEIDSKKLKAVADLAVHGIPREKLVATIGVACAIDDSTDALSKLFNAAIMNCPISDKKAKKLVKKLKKGVEFMNVIMDALIGIEED